MRALVVALAAGFVSSVARGQDVPAPEPTPLAGLAYTDAFFPGAHYDAKVPNPSTVLGFEVGSRPATHAQIEAGIKALAAASPRCKLFEYGKTHEGRTLYYLVIASEANIKRLDALQESYARLSDPRKVSAPEGDRLAAELPALAWMAYCIHGDEMSGSDASLAVAHHLAASTDDDVKQLLENEVVIIDPLMNPDGRDRYLTMLAQNRTAQPSVDDQSLLHTGFWPSGRMNHYLFDMNRDWIFATQPETRGRLRAINRWNPQYFMESHEMGSQDTFLFMPGREAINPNMPENIRKWEVKFAEDMARAFDAKGWRYYTGEWNDNWYPGYSSSWAALRGATENLYEQAGISTDAVRRAEGTLHTYREAAHKQLVATMANLNFLAKNRKEVLTDYLAEKRKSVGQGDGAVTERTFAVVPGANATRLRRLVDLLGEQSFEVSAAAQPFSASGKDRLGRLIKDHPFPAGTLLIPARQPLARLVAAMLEFDPRMSPEALTEERRELLRFDRSRIYDITAWSIPMLFDVECYEIGAAEGAQPAAARPPTVPGDPLQNLQTTVGFVIDGADDGAAAAAGRLMELGVRVRCANKPFAFDGHGFARGSVVVLLKDNPATAPRIEHTVDPLLGALRRTCNELSLTAVGITSGLGPGDLPDLGGEHFVLLQQPRIAIVGRDPISPYGFGQAWYFIDHVLGLRASYIDAANLGGSDLRRYNVLVVPPGGGDALKDKMDDLRAWAKSGGTLIAIGSSAAAMAKEKDGIGSTRLLPDVLGKLDPYRQAVVREWEGLRATPEAKDVWAFSPPEDVVYPWMIGEQGKADEDELKRRDAWRAIFMPAGAILAGRVDDRSWLTAGCGEYLPVLFSSDPVLLTPPGVQAPVRLGYFNPAPEKAEEKGKGDAPAAKGNQADQPTSTPPKGPPADDAADKPRDSKAEAKGEKLDSKSDPKKDDSKDDSKKDDSKKDGSKKDEKPAPGWTLAPKGYELRLRMSGLLWPEAAERVANAAYVTREGIGAGQVILFAGDPTFRGGALGTARVFENAVVFGPGMGASQPIQP